MKSTAATHFGRMSLPLWALQPFSLVLAAKCETESKRIGHKSLSFMVRYSIMISVSNPALSISLTRQRSDPFYLVVCCGIRVRILCSCFHLCLPLNGEYCILTSIDPELTLHRHHFTTRYPKEAEQPTGLEYGRAHRTTEPRRAANARGQQTR